MPAPILTYGEADIVNLANNDDPQFSQLTNGITRTVFVLENENGRLNLADPDSDGGSNDDLDFIQITSTNNNDVFSLGITDGETFNAASQDGSTTVLFTAGDGTTDPDGVQVLGTFTAANFTTYTVTVFDDPATRTLDPVDGPIVGTGNKVILIQADAPGVAEEYDINNLPTESALDIPDFILGLIEITPGEGTRDLQVLIDDRTDNEEVFVFNDLVATNEPPKANPDAFIVNEDDGRFDPLDLTFLTTVDGDTGILDNDTDDNDNEAVDGPSPGNIVSVTGTTTITSDATDPAGLSSPGTVNLANAGTEGALVTFSTDGSDPNPNGVVSDFNYLDEGESAVISFQYTIDDDDDVEGAATSTTTVTITVVGENDGIFIVPDTDLIDNDPGTNPYVNVSGAELRSDVADIIDELPDGSLVPEENNTILKATGTVRYIDPDVNDTHEFGVTPGVIDGDSPFVGRDRGATIEGVAAPIGFVGAFNATLEDGLPGDPEDDQITWEFVITDTEIDLLSGDQSFTQTYTLTIFETDAGDLANGPELAQQTVTVTITGTNDAPELALLAADSVSAELDEDVDGDGVDATGTITVRDVDLADSVTQSVRFTSITRVPTITTDGLDSNITDPVTNPNQVDVQNDGRPTDLELAQMLTLVDGEGFVVIPSVANLGAATGGTGTTGTITWEFDASGGNADQQFDYLADGEEVVITYTVTVTDFGITNVAAGDSDDIDINITITGINDDVVIESADSIGGVTEIAEVDEISTGEGANAAGPLLVTGDVTFSDLDFSDSHTTSIEAISSTLPNVPGGSETNLVDVDDSNGDANEEVVLGQTYGTLRVIPESFVESQGTEIGPNGVPFVDDPVAEPIRIGGFTWEYTVDDAVVEQLGAGETMIEVFEITIKDLAGTISDLDGGDEINLLNGAEEVIERGGDAVQTVTITVTGTNDQPVFSATQGGTGPVPLATVNETDANTGIAALDLLQAGLGEVEDIDVHDIVTILDIDVSVTGDGADGADNLTNPDPSSGVTRTEALEIVGITDNSGTDQVGETAIEGSTLIGNDETTGDLGLFVEGSDNFESLSENESVVLTYTMSIGDDSSASNATDTETLSITVIGQNDEVTIDDENSDVSDDTIKEVVESATTSGFPGAANSGDEGTFLHSVTGDILFTDLDIDDVHSATIGSVGGTLLTAASDAGQNTSLFIADPVPIIDEATGDGAGTIRWTFEINDSQIEFLREGQSETITFEVIVTDDSQYDDPTGALSSDVTTVTVTITGSNDAPTFELNGPQDLGTFSETEANLDTPVLTAFDIEDIDTSDVVTLEIDVAVGGEGAQQVSDGNGDGLTAAEVETIIDLVNNEGDPLDDSDDTDPDNDVVIQSGNTTGTILVGFNSSSDNVNGPTVDENDPTAFDYLSEGEELEVTITATATDDSSLAGTDTETVTVTIVGENDAVQVVQLGSDFDGAVTEVTELFPADPAQDPAETTTTLTDSGTIEFTDVDLDDTHTVSVLDSIASADDGGVVDGGPALGSLSFEVTEGAGLRGDNVGSFVWTYEVEDGAYEFLREGQTAIETFLIELEDLSPHDDDGNGDGTLSSVFPAVTVTITGTNDAPEVVSGPGDATFSEDVANSFGIPGGSTIQPPFQVEDIDLRDEVTIDLSVSVSGEGAEGASSGDTNPDDGLSAAEVESLLSLNGQDVDGQVVITTTETTGDFSLVFNDTTASTTGNVASDTVFDYLSEGEELIAEITGTISDDSGEDNFTDTETVTVTIVGQNDVAEINDTVGGTEAETFTLTGSVEEVVEAFPLPDEAGGVGPGEEVTDLIATGEVSFTDIDLDDTHTVEVVAVSSVVPGNVPPADQLGTTEVETFGTLVAEVAEDSTLDTENNDGLITWTYTVSDGAIEALGFGETAIETFEIILNEFSPHDGDNVLDEADRTTVTVTITGNNDAPEILAGDFDATVVEGDEDGDLVGTENDPDTTGPGIQDFGPLVATGSFEVRDIDINDIVTARVTDVSINGATTVPDVFGTGSSDVPSDEVNIDELFGMLSVDGIILNGQPVGLLQPIGWEAVIVDEFNTTGTLNWTFNSTIIDDQILVNGVDEPTDIEPIFRIADFDYIAAGEQLVLDYTIRVTDDSEIFADAPPAGESDFDEATVTITILGTNDRPEIDDEASEITGELEEIVEDDINESGLRSTVFDTIFYRDVDISDQHVIQEIDVSNGAAVDGSFVGSFDADVQNQALDQVEWSLEVQDSEIEHMREGETATQTYRVIVNDQEGGTDTTTVTVTFTGANDRPDITVDGEDSDAETLIEDNGNEIGPDGGLTVEGTLSVEDIDIHDVVVASSAIFSSDTDAQGQPDDSVLDAMFTVTGTSTENPVIIGGPDNAPTTELANSGFADGGTTGTIGWSFDSGEESFDYLQDGQSLVIQYTVTALDNSGVAESESDTQIVTITIIGTNDRPEIVAETDVDETLSEDNGIVGDEGDIGEALTTTGSFDIRDRDVLDEVNSEVVSVEASGNTTDAATPNNAALLGLLSLGDNPVISSTATEGTVNWKFSSAADLFDYLAVDEEIVLTYTVRSTDTSNQDDEPDANDEPNFIEQLVTITITGTNDEPFITDQSDVEALEEAVGPAEGLSTTGTIDVTDFDTTDVVTISSVEVAAAGVGFDEGSAVPDPALATVDLDAMFSPQDPTEVIGGDANTGTINWTFDSGEFGFDYLDENESVVLTYTVTVDDGEGGTDSTDIIITINGTNDAPTIVDATDVTGEVDEPGAAAQTAGEFVVGDLDTSDAVSVTGISVVIDGVDLGIADDDAALGLFEVSDNPAVASGANTGTVTWDFSLGESPNLFDYLAEGEEALVTYTIELTDDSGATVTQDVVITVTGTNDDPVISFEDGETEANLIERDGEQATAGEFTISDLDLNDQVFISTALKSAVGPAIGQPTDEDLDAYFDAGESPVIRNLNGSTTGDIEWTFATDLPGAEETFDYLDKGEELVLVYTVTATDLFDGSDTQDVTITITGTNDAPEIVGGDTTGAVTELTEDLEGDGETLTDTGTLDTVDLDLSDVNSVSAESVGDTLGSLEVVMNDDLTSSEESISWTYSVLDADVDFLQQGETLIEQFEVTLFDDDDAADLDQFDDVEATDTQIVTITITGTNDAPVIDLEDSSGVIGEDQLNLDFSVPTSEDVTVSDVDLLDEVTVEVSVASSTDASTSPTDEDLLSFFQVDPAAPDAVIDSTETEDTFSIDTFAPGDPFDYLSAGQELIVDYTITARDTQGATDTVTLSTTIVGDNDAFEVDLVNSDVEGEVTEVAEGGSDPEGSTTLSDTGSISITDRDIDDTYTAVVQAEDNEGDLAITLITLLPGGGATVDWEYSVADSAVEDLQAGETQIETFEVVLADVSPIDGEQSTFTQSVTVTITGTNDTPDISVGEGDSAAEDLIETNEPLSVDGTLSVEDLDILDTVSATQTFVSVEGPATGQPSEQVLADMFELTSVNPVVGDDTQGGVISWAFNTTPETFDYVAEGESVVLTYEITATDDSPSGATSDTQLVTITIIGTNDAPVIGDGVFTAEVFEIEEGGDQQETRVTSLTREISFGDLDLSDTHAVFTAERGADFVGDFAASVTDASTGDGAGTVDWTFQVGDDELAFLGEGESVVQEYDVQVVDFDGQGLSDSTVVSITLIGANDAPDAVFVDGGAVSENDPQSLELLDPTFVSDPDANDDLDVLNPVLTVSDGRTITSSIDLETGEVNIDPLQFRDLATGESVTVDVDYEITDGTEIVSNSASLTILGTDDDCFIATAPAETFDGGIGNDKVDFSNSDAGVNVDLDESTADGGFATGDVLISIEGLIGSDFGDVLRGDAGANTIDAGDGDDTVEGGGGADVLDGGDGIDTIDFSSGGLGLNGFGVILNLEQSNSNVPSVGGALDVVTFSNFENVIGTAFNDIIFDSNEANTLFGADGRDLLIATDGADVLYGGDDFDAFVSGTGAFGNQIFGGEGIFDTVGYFDAATDLVFDLRTPFDDPDNETSEVIKRDTFDSIETFFGTNIGSNTFFLSDGPSEITAVAGGGQADTVFGGAADDVIVGLQGDDVIYGGDGSDFMRGDRGDDQLFGGDGPDFFLFDDDHGLDTINDFVAGFGDRINFYGANTRRDGFESLDIQQVGDNVEIAYGTGSSVVTVLNTTTEEVESAIIIG